jgi:hypothetical protein
LSYSAAGAKQARLDHQWILNMENLVDPTVLSTENSHSLAWPRDPTIVPTVACLIVGAVIAVYATIVSVPDPDALATMVALP